MSAHTPGPWSIPHFAADTNCECGYVLCDHLMGAVATVHCSGEGQDWQRHGDNPKFAEACANARLIAAAPELLHALKDLVGQEEPGAMFSERIQRALAAIAKAEGAAPVYVDDDGKTWCRPEGEFEDGRFEPAPRRDLTPEEIVALVNDG